MVMKEFAILVCLSFISGFRVGCKGVCCFPCLVVIPRTPIYTLGNWVGVGLAVIGDGIRAGLTLLGCLVVYVNDDG